MKEFSEVAKEQEYAGKAEDKALITDRYDFFVKCLEESIKAVQAELEK